MTKTKGYEKLPEDIRFAYYSGAKVMFDALATALHQGLDFNDSLLKMGNWLDNALLPWGQDNKFGITGIKYSKGFPLPPDVDHLPEI